MYKGSCLCGEIRFELLVEPKAVTHCHCTMCQKQHGAAFATYASLPKDKLRYTAGQDKLSTYHSSGTILRKFCQVCGSNIEWSGSEKYPDWVSIAIATFDTPFMPKHIKHIYTESQACWLKSGDNREDDGSTEANT